MNSHPFDTGATSSPNPSPDRRGRGVRGFVAVTAAVALAALLTPFIPATDAVAASDRDEAAPRKIVAESRPAGRPEVLSAAQRKRLLEAASDDRATTARALRLGGQEALIPKDVIEDADGTVHTRYERTYAGLPVIGGDLVVHERAGTRTVTKASSARITVPTTKAAVSAAEAKKSALSAAKNERTRNPAASGDSRLVVFIGDGKPTLAWQSYVTGTQTDGTPSRLDVVTDAATGKRLRSVEEIHSGVGHSRYSGQVEIGTVNDNGVYELTDPERGGHKTYDMTGAGGNGDLVTDDDDVWGDGTDADRQTAAVDAAYGQRETWDFYKERFGRNGIADNGVGALSRVHFGDGFANAFWDDLCFCMTYGDGHGNGNPLTELDIAAHEMTHGVTYASANLTYSGESGGLNEATSDIMATAVEFFANSPADVPDYTIGELADVRGTGKPLRYMDQPSKDADPVKGTSQDYWTPDTGKQDVHHSSGPANHFFYLLSEGSGKKTINGVDYDSPTYDGLPVAGIGLRNATDIWYRALTTYMTSTTDYAAARTATLQAAADLFGRGSATYEAVGNAWAAVSVGSRYVSHIAVTAPSTRPVAVGQPTTRQIEAVGSSAGELNYSAHNLPKGLSINPRTGLISGTPKKAGIFKTAVTVENTAQHKARRTVRFDWPVLASGGRYFVNPARYDIPNWKTIESPLIVTGRKGNAPSDLKVTIDLVHPWVGGQVVTLVSENGTEIPVKPWYWDTGEGEIHATYTVDASAVPANGTWKLRVTDDTPGIFQPEPGYLDRWSLTF
ncbi:M4 family metallopeptidase [Streptomyces sp. MK5]|uniref:M4 family metallopeptidase n=1 Tax=Streptomyces sp. MK5 TaxID=3064253 RepID=UPI00274214A7|nr:M4 family metallopeptidase [Streptomyces sp. MK5]